LAFPDLLIREAGCTIEFSCVPLLTDLYCREPIPAKKQK